MSLSEHALACMPNAQTDVRSGRESTGRHDLIRDKLLVLNLNIEDASCPLHRTKGIIDQIENHLMHLHGIGRQRIGRVCDLRSEFNPQGDRRAKEPERFFRQGME